MCDRRSNALQFSVFQSMNQCTYIKVPKGNLSNFKLRKRYPRTFVGGTSIYLFHPGTGDKLAHPFEGSR